MTWVSYAQNYEDVTLMRALAHVERGFWIDVGAHDPRVDSVTRAFSARGWRGINLEPVPHWFERLAADRPRDVNLPIAAGAAEGRLVLHEVEGTGLSTTDAALAARHAAAGLTVRRHEVPVRPLAAICREHGVGVVHFMKIDVEGAERAVLEGFDFARVRPWIVVVESTAPCSPVQTHAGWEPLLVAHDYRFAWFDGLNRFYVAAERAWLAPALAVPPNVLDDFMRYAERLLRDDLASARAELDAQRARSDAAIAAERARADQAERSLRSLQASRSWRIAAPLRGAGALARRVRDMLRGAAPGDAASAAPGATAVPPAGEAPAPCDAPPATAAPCVAASPPSAAAAARPGDARPVGAPMPGPASADAPARRPRMAFVSPLPPAPSGVADYAAALLPALARHYEIDVVDPRADEPGVQVPAGCRLIGVERFEADVRHYDRIVHQIGNSLLHVDALALLERHGGVVVLHDLVLADLFEHLERSGAMPGRWQRALYRSHGWPALRDAARRGPAAVRTWPASGEVFDAADGVIVNSAWAARWARSLYGADVDVAVGGLARRVEARRERAQARRRLGIDADAFVVCTFGAGDASKQWLRLAQAWQRSTLCARPGHLLAFVGAIPGGDDGARLRAVAAHGVQDDARARSPCDGAAAIVLAGRVEADRYRDWLAAADLAVQLRTDTRGETSGAVLDCLAHGIPTIVNAHGPLADLPASAVRLLDDRFDDAALVEAIERLRDDAGTRARLADGAAALVRDAHDPEVLADAYARAIEHFHTASARGKPHGPRQLLVDVTALALHDLRSGIQRVVRSVLNLLLERQVPGVRVEPVYLCDGGYRFARAWTARTFGLPAGLPADAPVDVRAGDVFLGLDLVTHGVHLHESVFRDWRARGVRIHFVVYDLLPVELPDRFPAEDAGHYRCWLETVCRVADGLACISRATADALATRLPALAAGRDAPPAIDWFHLGADVPASLPSTGVTSAEHALAERLARRRAFLMVGTVEPRKGHALAIDAFERLWRDGEDVDLVIVGRAGWMVDALVERLRAHPERGARLVWLDRASDELLERLYRACSVLLMLSEGEGFGLPLIEAAQHGLPIVSRDLPVFREVAGESAFWWDDGGHRDGEAAARSLAQALARWLALRATGQAPSPAGMRWRSWETATDELLRIVLGPQAALVEAAALVAPPGPSAAAAADVSAVVPSTHPGGIDP